MGLTERDGARSGGGTGRRCGEGNVTPLQSSCPENPVDEETRVATRVESGVLGFPSRRGLTPRGSLECNPEIPAFPGEEN